MKVAEAERLALPIANFMSDVGASSARTLHQFETPDSLPSAMDDPLLVRSVLARAERPPRPLPARVAVFTPIITIVGLNQEGSLPANLRAYSSPEPRVHPSLRPVQFLASADDEKHAIADPIPPSYGGIIRRLLAVLARGLLALVVSLR